MTNITPSADVAASVTLDGSRSPLLSPADAAVLGASSTPAPPVSAPPPSAAPVSLSEFPASPPKWLRTGRVLLRSEVLRFLRHQKLLSQQDMANDSWRRNIRLSIATIKRAELGDAVRFRTAHQFARFFDVPVEYLLLNPTK
jgi:hypothetical protein